jgi:uncharacterized protein
MKRRLFRKLTFLCVLLLCIATGSASAQNHPLINEFVFNHTGSDTFEYIEIYGAPNTDYSSYTILQIDGDSTVAGTIDSVFAVGTSDVKGFWTTGFLDNKLENGTVTLLLVTNFTGALGADIDIDNNGIIDYAPWGSIVDAVGITDGDVNDKVYANTVLQSGYDGLAAMPGGASRIPDGMDTQSVTDWVRNDYDGAGLPGFTGTLDAWEAVNTPGSPNQLAKVARIVINEVDADTPGTDTLEFVELFDGGFGNTPLDGLVVVFFNGNDDRSYMVFDLDGYSTDANGFFVLGNALVPNVGLVFPNNALQNGPDAVALYYGNASDFPSGTLATTPIDALVYDTGDADDPNLLLILLNASQPQIDENGLGNKDNHSNQRCPNGLGGQRNTATYCQATPTPGASNNCDLYPGRIRGIQGKGHKSLYAGSAVTGVHGIVTAITPHGFYMQDPEPDADPATSEGIYVYTRSPPPVSVGDSVRVTGAVQEYYPDGYSSGNLSITEITTPVITVVSSGNALPLPVIIGAQGRIPPSMVIDDDATGDIETSGTFDPQMDGIDFYESLEGMLVQINDAIVVGPKSSDGEITVVGDAGVNAGIINPRGALVIRSNDFNPERLILDNAFLPFPEVSVGDGFPGNIVGVMDYGSGNFRLLATTLPEPSGLSPPRETTPPRSITELSVATFNMTNLNPSASASRFQQLAQQIANHLRAPDIIGVQEIQDNSGPQDNGVVDASYTYTLLVDAIQAAGGPHYEYMDIPPVNNMDGGQPGGNVRVGFLYRPDRVSFVERPGGDALSPTTVLLGPTGIELSFNPGRVDPSNPAFTSSRKPLAGEFLFNGKKVFVIVNHFSSKDSDNSLFGRLQPPVLNSEPQRVLQAQVVHDFVQSILSLDSNARIIVLGDLNDFQFSSTLSTLKGNILSNLTDSLPQEERYTYIYEGNAEALDHILVSGSLSRNSLNIDVVHVNAEFSEAERPTDHDPVIVGIQLESAAVCECDINDDGDVDGSDLAALIASAGPIDVVKFAQALGTTDCLQ